MVRTKIRKGLYMFKQVFYACLIVLTPIAAYCGNSQDEAQKNYLAVPLLQYDYLKMDDQCIRSASTGLLLEWEDVKFTGIYTRHEFSEPLSYDFPNVYHSIDMLFDAKKGRNQYLVIVKSDSDKPVSGGISTYQAAAVYGKEMIQGSRLSLVLGGGIAVGDFGVEKSNGDVWPVIPVPLVRMNYQTDQLDVKFEFLTSPNLSFTIAPKNQIRLNCDFRMDQMRDARDIIFETNLEYRFFTGSHKFGDFAGVSIGFKNDNIGAFTLGNKNGEETLEAHYYSLFATIDLSVIKVSAGRAFDGRLLYRDEIRENAGSGDFISVQCILPF